ncbi:MAG: hypothetical protein KJN90_04450, partial [Gammaproteobacteria bacterium]|nr:hypothetical protein [Gammaproteobacteria bacterium]
MKTTKLLRALLAVLLLMLGAGHVSAQQATIALTGDMVDSVNVFMNGLSMQQQSAAAYAFDDEERLNWHFIP